MVGKADFDFGFCKLPTTTQNHNASFVPLSNGEAGRNAPFKRNVNFPYLGFVCLVGSALTILASWTILFALNHREVLEIDFLTPASWLSAVLSTNNILLHLALAEGVNIAWWYRATTKEATAAELHDTWTYGTSLSSAVLSGKNLSYVALATIAVATIPLNGLLLQNAIAQVQSTKTMNKQITIPLMKAFPLGYSATINPDGTLGMLGRDWSGTVWSWMNLQGVRTALSADFGDDVDAECLHACQTFVPGAGFQATCSRSTLPYDLLPNRASSNGTTKEAQILSSSITWEPSHPNQVNLNLLWKEGQSCTGVYQVRNCTLEAATKEYAVQIDYKPIGTGVNYSNPLYSLNENSTYKDDALIEILPVYEQEGKENSTYGGIAAAFASYFNSSMWFSQDRSSFNQTGIFATYMMPHIPLADNSSICNVTFQALQWDPDLPDNTPELTDVVLEAIRKVIFLAAVEEGAYNDNLGGKYYQRPMAQQSGPVHRYKVRYRFWAATLVITFVIIVFISPTFYGWWVLHEKVTMSPFETARVFNNSVVDGTLNHDTPYLLKKMRSKNVHDDLVHSQVTLMEDRVGFLDINESRGVRQER
jgi:hypothetical protein